LPDLANVANKHNTEAWHRNGPRQGHIGVQGLIGTFLNKFIRDEPLEIWGDGSVVRDYIYIADLARLCVTAIEKNVTGIFNAGSGVGHSINEIVETLKNVTEVDLDVRHKEGRSFDIQRSVLDIQRAKQVFDWQPETVLEEGMAEHLNWLKSQVATKANQSRK